MFTDEPWLSLYIGKSIPLDDCELLQNDLTNVSFWSQLQMNWNKCETI